jgi:hypothetical protein
MGEENWDIVGDENPCESVGEGRVGERNIFPSLRSPLSRQEESLLVISFGDSPEGDDGFIGEG